MTIHFSDNIFPVGFMYLVLKADDEDSLHQIARFKGESAKFLARIFALANLEGLEVRQDRFTMTFEDTGAWKRNFESFRSILKEFFPKTEVVLR